MPKLYSSNQTLLVLYKHGFLFISQKGSHIKLRKIIKGKVFTVIIPDNKKEIPIGTFASIVRQSDLKKEDF